MNWGWGRGDWTLSNPLFGPLKGLEHFCQRGIIKRIPFLAFKKALKASEECSCGLPPCLSGQQSDRCPASSGQADLGSLPQDLQAIALASLLLGGSSRPPPLAQAIPRTLSPLPGSWTRRWSLQGWQRLAREPSAILSQQPAIFPCSCCYIFHIGPPASGLSPPNPSATEAESPCQNANFSMVLPWSQALPAQSTKFKGLTWFARLQVSCPGLPFRRLLPGSPSHTTPCSCGNEHLPPPVPSQVKCHLLPANVGGTQTAEVCPILGFVPGPFAVTEAPAP